MNIGSGLGLGGIGVVRGESGPGLGLAMTDGSASVGWEDDAVWQKAGEKSDSLDVYENPITSSSTADSSVRSAEYEGCGPCGSGVVGGCASSADARSINSITSGS